MQANLPSLSPMQCTEQISKAKKALCEGKQSCPALRRLGRGSAASKMAHGNGLGNSKVH
jgi:hypothetical protein